MRGLTGAFPIVVAILLIAVVSHAQEFAADTVSLVNGRQIQGRFYYKVDRWRVEAEADGKHQTSIIRKDKKMVWHMAVQQKQYLQLTLSGKDLAGLAFGSVPGEVKREQIGKESVHGRSTTKYRIYCKIDNNDGIFYQWVDDEYGMPVKVSDKEGKYVSEFRNIKFGPQSEDLFELPAGYTMYTIDLTKLKK